MFYNYKWNITFKILITTLYTYNLHIIIYQLYLNLKKKKTENHALDSTVTMAANKKVTLKSHSCP